MADEACSDIDGLLNAAFEAAEAGRLDDAEAQCRKILLLNPRDFDATLLLGIIAGETGRFDLGETLLRDAVAIEPDSAEAHLKLGGLLHQAGNPAEAACALQEAIRLAPGMALAHHDLGVIYLQTDRIGEAIGCFEQAVMHAPDLPIAHHRLGYSLELDGDDVRAIASYRRALELNPDLTEALLRLETLLEGTGRAAETLPLLRRAAQADPDAATGRRSTARLLVKEGRIDEAEQYLSEALGIDPDDAWLHQIRGNCLQQLGRFDEAIACFERVIALDPNLVLPYYDIINSRKMTKADRPLIDRLTVLLAEPGLPNRTRTTLAFALGKALDDLGDYAGAIRYFDDANRLRHRFSHFDCARIERFVDLSIAGFNRDFIRRSAARGARSDLPLFVLGMPRSGTTLVEQILSSHPTIAGAGELMFWSDCAARLGKIPVAGLDPAVMAAFAEQCVALLTAHAPWAARVTDKMPDNFRYVGLIHAVFPNARIIHCRRHPLDTALSIYVTQFAAGMDYAYHRADIAAMYTQYCRLMAHWRSVIPADRFLEIDYEDVVADREGAARKLISFCGLAWNDMCLRHEDNRRVVKTASIWQARQPIYKTSVARWKRYEPWLGELQQLRTDDQKKM